MSTTPLKANAWHDRVAVEDGTRSSSHSFATTVVCMDSEVVTHQVAKSITHAEPRSSHLYDTGGPVGVSPSQYLWISPAINIMVYPQPQSTTLVRHVQYSHSPWFRALPASATSIQRWQQDHILRGNLREVQIREWLSRETVSETARRLCGKHVSKFMACFPEAERENRKQRQEMMNAQTAIWNMLMQDAVKLKAETRKQNDITRQKEAERERGRKITNRQTLLATNRAERERVGVCEQMTKENIRRLHLEDLAAGINKRNWFKGIGIEEETESPVIVKERRALLEALGIQAQVRENDDMACRENEALRRWVRMADHRLVVIKEAGEPVKFMCDTREEKDLASGASTWAFCCAGF